MPSLNHKHLPILNRDITIGFALVRESAELGSYWVNKALNKSVKLNGNDFADVAKYLIKKNIILHNLGFMFLFLNVSRLIQRLFLFNYC